MESVVLKSQSTEYDDLQELYEHNKRVGLYAQRLASLVLTDEELIEKVRKAASFHDIGKMYIDRTILNKPSKFTEKEAAIVRKHPEHGYDTLVSIGEDKEVAQMVKEHHESFDGTGYPDGLAKCDICIGARIIKICDVFDALTVSRVYRSKLTNEQAFRAMDKEKGTFDRRLYKVFKDNVDVITKTP